MPRAVPGITMSHKMVGIVEAVVKATAEQVGADVVWEVAGCPDTFRMARQPARPNAIVTMAALYDGPQSLPLPEMYGKNLTIITGSVDGCNCDETLALIAEGKLDTPADYPSSLDTMEFQPMKFLLLLNNIKHGGDSH